MHASGSDEEYVKKAIAENVKILGFSDHSPSTYNEDYTSYYRMAPEEAPGYFASLRALRAKYADEIELHIGYEVEYFHSNWKENLEMWKKNPPEYLILGQHYVDFEYYGGRLGNHSYREAGSLDKDRIKPYADIVIEALSSDKISCLAHPDVLTYTGEDQDYYLEQMKRIIDAAKKYGVPIEYNLLGQSERRKYPRRDFWELVGQLGGSAVIGCDAHEPCRVADKEELSEANTFLKSVGVNIIDTIELRKPFA